MSGFTDDHFKLLNLQEIEQREKEIEQAKVSDFLDADGEIDTNKILERGYLIQAFTFENGKITNFKLSNGDKYPFGKSGHVYMIQAENGLIKIGASTNVKGRLKAIRTASPVELNLIGNWYQDEVYTAESKLHRKYKEKRVRGEWFCLTDDDIEEIVKNLTKTP